MPGPALASQEKGLRRHSGEGARQTPGGGPAAPLYPCRPQQEEERGEEQAVAGIVKHLEDGAVQPLQRRGLAHQAIPAVPSDADQVENGGDTQSGAVGQPGQVPSHHHSQQHRREVPQVVQGAVGQQLFYPFQGGITAVVPVQGQVEGHGREIEEQGFPKKAAGVLPLAFGQEIAADYEKEGHRQPGQHPGEKEVRRGGEAVQGARVVADHQHRRQQTETVQRRALS